MSAGADETATSLWRRLTPYAVGLVTAFVLYPFVSFLNRNRAEIPQTGRLTVYALVASVVALAVLVGLAALRPAASVDRLAAGLAAFLVSFSGFHLLFSPEPVPGRRLPQLLAWVVLTVLLVVLVYRLSRLAPVRTFLLVMAVVLTALPLAEYAAWRLGGNDATSQAEARVVADGPPPELESTPNIYYFLLDEYGRNDQLLEVLDFDNQGFHDEMASRDFVVVEGAHSPFQQTVMSMASVLDMAYVATSPDEAPDGNQPFTNRLRGHNATVDYFKAQGYDYVYSSPGVFDWQRCESDVVDLCIEAKATGLNLSEMDLSLLDLTPIGSLDIAKERITDPAYVMEQFEAHRDEIDEPFFLYAHTLSPHGPFRYEDDCSLRDRFADYQDLSGKTPQDKRDYSQDVACLNELILRAVDQILDDDPDAIVIVASDHGSKFIPDGFKRLEEWRPAAIREELATQFAIRLPEACRDDAAAMVNTIETFRIVTACLEGRPPDPIENRVFIWPAEGPGPQEIDDLTVLDPQP
jgi:hypothetical protein